MIPQNFSESRSKHRVPAKHRCFLIAAPGTPARCLRACGALHRSAVSHAPESWSGVPHGDFNPRIYSVYPFRNFRNSESVDKIRELLLSSDSL